MLHSLIQSGRLGHVKASFTSVGGSIQERHRWSWVGWWFGFPAIFQRQSWASVVQLTFIQFLDCLSEDKLFLLLRYNYVNCKESSQCTSALRLYNSRSRAWSAFREMRKPRTLGVTCKGHSALYMQRSSKSVPGLLFYTVVDLCSDLHMHCEAWPFGNHTSLVQWTLFLAFAFLMRAKMCIALEHPFISLAKQQHPKTPGR